MKLKTLCLAISLGLVSGPLLAGGGNHHGNSWRGDNYRSGHHYGRHHQHSRHCEHNHYQATVVERRVVYVQPAPRVYHGEVVEVVPVYAYNQSREESCVRYDNSRPGYTSYTATILGAVVGGTVGHKIGDSYGDANVAAVAGGLLGASLGRDVSQRAAYQRQLVVAAPCRASTAGREPVIVEYQVTYRYNGRVYHSNMDHHPGDWIRLDEDYRPA